MCVQIYAPSTFRNKLWNLRLCMRQRTLCNSITWNTIVYERICIYIYMCTYVHTYTYKYVQRHCVRIYSYIYSHTYMHNAHANSNYVVSLSRMNSNPSKIRKLSSWKTAQYIYIYIYTHVRICMRMYEHIHMHIGYNEPMSAISLRLAWSCMYTFIHTATTHTHTTQINVYTCWRAGMGVVARLPYVCNYSLYYVR